MILWTFVLGNFTKALTGFTDQRLLTEGVILVHAVIVTLLILLLPGEDRREQSVTPVDPRRLVRGARFSQCSACWLSHLWNGPPCGGSTAMRHAGHAGQNFRFGENADWKMHPVLKGGSAQVGNDEC